MADPRKELIAQNLLTTLKTILKTGGFYTDAGVWASRRRIPLTTWNGSHDEEVFLLVGPEVQDTSGNCLGGNHKANVRFGVLGYVHDQEPERKLILLEADIKKAVLTDVNRGGYADKTEIADSGPLTQLTTSNMDWWEMVSEQYGAVIVGFDVTYNWTVASP
jgi:hypothetical protein